MTTVSIDLSKGIPLTFAPETREDQVIQELYILLNTAKGEVPYYREYGIDSSYLHKPINIAKTMYAAAINEGVNKFIPGASLKRVRFNDASDPASLVPILEVTLYE